MGNSTVRLSAPLLLLSVLLCGGCAATKVFSVDESEKFASLSYVGYTDTKSIGARLRLFKKEILSGYLIEDSEDGFKFEEEPYEAEPRGVFGWGPRWQEKVSFTVKEIRPKLKQHEIISLGTSDTNFPNARVSIEAQVWERQNSGHPWRKAASSREADNERVRRMFTNLQHYLQ
jgi:hypothetical protein